MFIPPYLDVSASVNQDELLRDIVHACHICSQFSFITTFQRNVTAPVVAGYSHWAMCWTG